MSLSAALTPLSEAQIAQYYREGYLLVPGLVPAAEVAAVVAAFPAVDPAGTNWTASTFDHQHPTKDAARHRLLIEPHIVAAAEQIFEAPARVYYGMTAAVPPHGGRGLPWHQDNQYNQILFNALNIFVALCDITPDKAILWVAPGTHKRGTQPSQEATALGGHREAVVEPENGFPLPGMKAGDVCIFDRNTYHRSLKNETDEVRYAYAAQYMADYARKADTGTKDPLKMRASELRAQLLPLL